MKPIEKDELFQNLQAFLKTKGVELKDGSYAQKVQKSCGLLSDAINAGHKGLSRAKVEIDKKLGQLRQVIHEKTAPPGRSAPSSQPASNPSAEKPASIADPRKPRTHRKRKGRKAS